MWPELLRRAMEAELLDRASTMAMERKENGEALVIPFSLEEEEEVVDGEAEDEDTDAVDRRHARAYLRCYAEYFADELEIIEHLKAAEYDRFVTPCGSSRQPSTCLNESAHLNSEDSPKLCG